MHKNRCNCCLVGTPDEIDAQKEFLGSCGIIPRLLGPPIIEPQTIFDQAITLLYKSRIPGWQNYLRLVEIGVCQQSELEMAQKA